MNIELDDESSNTLPSTTSGDLSGDYQPENDPLSVFDGEPAAGTWTLTVTDDVGGDGGTLDNWGLEFNTAGAGTSAGCAATSCLNALDQDPAAADGDYWIDGYSIGVAELTTCDMTNGGWTQVDGEDFEVDAPDADWSLSSTYSCGGDTLLGGYNIIASGTIERTYDTSIIEHTEARIQTEYWAIDSWDAETAWIDIDGNNVWTTTFDWNNASDICGDWYGDQSASVDETLSHSATTLLYSAGASLSSGADDESFGVDDVVVWIR